MINQHGALPVPTTRRWLEPALILAALAAGAGAARLPLLPLVATAAGVGLILAALVEPMAALALTLMVAPAAAYENFMTKAPLHPLDSGQLLLLLTLGAWLVRGLARREIRLPLSPLLLPLVLFSGWAAVSLLWAPSYEYAIPELVKWVEIVLVMLMVAGAAQENPRRLLWVLGGVLASGAFQGALGIWQARLRGQGPDTFRLAEGIYRAYGSFEQPNPYAGYLGLIWPVAAGLALGLAWQAVSSRRVGPAAGALLAGLAAGLAGSGILLSWSRGAWMGAIAVVGAMAVALPRRLRLGLAGGIAVTLLLAGAYWANLLPASIRARLIDFTSQVRVADVRGANVTEGNYSVMERLAHWQAAGEMIRFNAWTGVGLSNYEPVYPRYALMNWPIPLGHAHNYYLNVAAELGMPGFLAYVFLWAVILRQTARELRRGWGWKRGLAVGLLGAWASISVHNLFDNLYVNNTYLLVGALLGVLMILNLERGE